MSQNIRPSHDEAVCDEPSRWKAARTPAAGPNSAPVEAFAQIIEGVGAPAGWKLGYGGDHVLRMRCRWFSARLATALGTVCAPGLFPGLRISAGRRLGEVIRESSMIRRFGPIPGGVYLLIGHRPRPLMPG